MLLSHPFFISSYSYVLQGPRGRKEGSKLIRFLGQQDTEPSQYIWSCPCVVPLKQAPDTRLPAFLLPSRDALWQTNLQTFSGTSVSFSRNLWCKQPGEGRGAEALPEADGDQEFPACAQGVSDSTTRNCCSDFFINLFSSFTTGDVLNYLTAL